MKTLLGFLFVLSCVLVCLALPGKAFGQAYSSTVLQNSAGNYGRPVPYPQVLVCASSDNAVPCINRVATYSDDTLATQCTQTGSSGLLIGNPTSGTNCNNPGIGDVNGNFTIYVAGGEYTICTYSGTWLCQKQTIGGGNSGSGIVNSCTGAHCDAYYPLANVPSIVGDTFATDDGSGNKAAKSYQFTDPNHSGFWFENSGPALPALASSNAVYFAPKPLNTFSSYGFEPWDSIPTVGDCIDLAAGDFTGWIKLHDSGNPCGSGSGATFQTNGVNNSSQTTLNNENGLGVTVSNPSAGNVQYALAGATQLVTPTAPTLAVGGTPGSSTICYKIVANEDTNGHTTAASTQTCVTNANSTLSSSPITLTAYADTLYSAKCVDIYRVSTNGTSPTTTGRIAQCVGKQFIDNGLAGDGTSPPTSNNTLLLPSYDSTHNCNTPPNGDVPRGIDGPPCSPNATDDEFKWTGLNSVGAASFLPGDANDPVWTDVNTSTNSFTMTMTGGVLSMVSASQSSTPGVHCIFQPIGSTPASFTTLVYPTLQSSSFSQSNNYNWQAGIAFRESSTGKIEMFGPQFRSSSPFVNMDVNDYTNPTTLSNTPLQAPANSHPIIENYGAKYDGTNVTYYNSSDGITYFKEYSVTKTTFFTTAPNQVGLCYDGTLSPGVMDWANFRRASTQLP